MVYFSDGNGRDGFIILGPHEKYGAYGKIIREIQSDQQQVRHNEMWERLDRKVKNSSSLRESHYRLASVNTNKVHGAPSEVADKKYYDQHGNRPTLLNHHTSPSNTSSTLLLKRRTVTEVILSEPLKIPNYQGHIPGTHDIIGASPYSRKFKENLLSSLDYHANTIGGGLNGSLSLPSLNNNNNKRSQNLSEMTTLPLPEHQEDANPTCHQETNASNPRQQSNQNNNKQETSFRVSPSTKSFSKFVSPVRIRKENRHASSYSGHVPSSTQVNQVFNASHKY
ncbi:hypothetical protein FDP41_003992 [Naegleria fowleri]|uniref:Uncharacterized protein n=1 Tax=Naegleria fowleri TaxID=5763 RepID=A0A6A5BIA8_NAEFO|nr:uncharacterized protein FDP41_003992 [Naegleria fowleri]KAF0976697.1 hypothetical protein FDP41_003992 [Naegleria fowleri]CAG4713343.1 unnamed protein product [Naegleria fowleri]